MSKIIFSQTLFLGAMLFGFVLPTNAEGPIKGHYVESRKDVPVWNKEVCGAFKKYLDSFPPADSYRGCGLKPSPAVKEITFPEWKKIDIFENAQIVKKMDLFIAGNNYTEEAKKSDWRDAIKHALAEDPNYSLYVASMDIDNDGKPETVYRKDYLVSSCPTSDRIDFPPAPRMIAFDENGNINRQASLFLSLGQYVFFYQGKTYWTLWGTNGQSNGVSVERFRGSECRFTYIRKL